MKRLNVWVLCAAVLGCLAFFYGCGVLGNGTGEPVLAGDLAGEAGTGISEAAPLASALSSIFGPVAGVSVLGGWVLVKALMGARYREHVGNAAKNLIALKPVEAVKSLAAAEGMVHSADAPVVASTGPTLPPS